MEVATGYAHPCEGRLIQLIVCSCQLRAGKNGYIEKDNNSLSPEDRLQLRVAQSIALVEEIRQWLDEVISTGTFKEVGRVYQQTYVDTFAKVAHCKLYTTKTPITAADLLNDQVLPYYAEHGLPV